jgi:hypothetical protein
VKQFPKDTFTVPKNGVCQLDIVSYPFEAKPWPIKVSWSKMTELTLEMSDATLIWAADKELKDRVYRITLDKVLSQISIDERRRLDKIVLFARQTGIDKKGAWLR